MRKRNEKGFTLIEVVVVVAVIAILAAVLTPYITKYIDDSKIAKARNEVQVVAAAVTNAYKDLGRWPNRNTAATDFGGLYTGATTPAAAFFGAATGWTAAGAGWNALDTHLATNGHGYPAAGDTKWSGPYATSVARRSVGEAVRGQSRRTVGPLWVLSAGPNLRIQTAAADNVVRGDDIGFRVR